MSGIPFYLTKALAIATISILYFITLGLFAFAFAKLLPDDPKESIYMSMLIMLVYIAGFTLLFYVARTQLKSVPRLFDGIAGFNADLLKEKEGSAFSAFAMVLLAKGLVERSTRVRDFILTKFA